MGQGQKFPKSNPICFIWVSPTPRLVFAPLSKIRLWNLKVGHMKWFYIQHCTATLYWCSSIPPSPRWCYIYSPLQCHSPPPSLSPPNLAGTKEYNKMTLMEAGVGHSAESSCLPPMCRRRDSRHHMWVEFVVGFPPCSEGFSPGSPVFFPPQTPTLPNSNSIRNTWPHKLLALKVTVST